MNFKICATSQPQFSLIQWDFDSHGIPRRSIQVETEIAHLWARAPIMKVLCGECLEYFDALAIDDPEDATVNELRHTLYDVIN